MSSSIASFDRFPSLITSSLDTLMNSNDFVEKFMEFYSKNTSLVLTTSGATAAVLLWQLFLKRDQNFQRNSQDYDSLIGVNKLLNGKEHTLKQDEFDKNISTYEGMFDGARQNVGSITSSDSINERKARYATMVDHFYNIVTDFYEYGWGQSFHFAPRWKNETFNESIKRAEHFVAARLGLSRGMTCLDVGCGVGGPMRNIAVFSGAHITGITINQYQVNIGNKYNQNLGLSDRCHITQGDFQNLPFESNSFDSVYEIEATCHSPDRVACFSGIHRVLKSGGKFCGYEWVMLDRYDPNNRQHVRIKEGIEVGNALPTLVHYSEIVRNMEAAGFVDIEYFDANSGAHLPSQIPWYDSLSGKMSLSGFRMTYLGRLCTHSMVWLLETLWIAPAGSTKISALLNATALDLVEGGKEGIFTPSFFFIGTKK
jgi:sterol 24-C-methyltransferase